MGHENSRIHKEVASPRNSPPFTNTLEAREVQAMFASTFPTPHCANGPWDGSDEVG